jgi:hypothetical protein
MEEPCFAVVNASLSEGGGVPVLGTSEDSTSFPGAKMSMHVPKLLNDVILSTHSPGLHSFSTLPSMTASFSVAPTVIAGDTPEG